jgi:peptidoglycan/LPS O-acetylase OafA/YrhL
VVRLSVTSEAVRLSAVRPRRVVSDVQYLPGGDEAGTPPGDRAFRPDVEGLRAIAILAVVLFHAGVPHITGGFVGVDVFFVISGFVITGLLLRQRNATGTTSFLTFYARRVRRILPAALLVIVVSIIATAAFVGGRDTALFSSDGRWTALFLGNVHFSHAYPSLFATRPTSPLQQYWSLAVEEQFYLVYPALFVALLTLRGTWSTRARLAIGLSAVIFVSFVASVATSHAGQFAAYDSPFTRAWELALGALVAVGAVELEKIPKAVAAVMTWVGVALIGLSATAFSAHTVYPGSAAAVPVLGAALIIAGGTAAPVAGAEALLHLWPFRWIGRLSYSWYLWHFPVLVIVAAHNHTTVGRTSVAENLMLVTLALGLAAGTYFLVENPIRHSQVSPKASLIGAGLLVITCVAVTYAF